MKTQILLTVDIDSDAQFRDMLPPAPKIQSRTILAEINTELRVWAMANPFNLRDPDHLRLSLVIGQDATPGSVEKKFADDLDRIAGDLTALARIVRSVS